jgi:hypothetical protein
MWIMSVNRPLKVTRPINDRVYLGEVCRQGPRTPNPLVKSRLRAVSFSTGRCRPMPFAHVAAAGECRRMPHRAGLRRRLGAPIEHPVSPSQCE